MQLEARAAYLAQASRLGPKRAKAAPRSATESIWRTYQRQLPDALVDRQVAAAPTLTMNKHPEREHRAFSLPLAIAAYAVAICAHASPITYTYSGTANGSLGGVPFSNAPFTILLAGDTTGITPPNILNYRENPATATAVRIAGFPEVTFGGLTVRQISTPPVELGIRLTGIQFDALFLSFFDSQSNLSYNLSGPFGPYSGPVITPFVVLNIPVPTSGGPLTLIPSGQVTFVAAPVAVAQQIPLSWWPIDLAVLMFSLLAFKVARRA